MRTPQIRARLEDGYRISKNDMGDLCPTPDALLNQFRRAQTPLSKQVIYLHRYYGVAPSVGWVRLEQKRLAAEEISNNPPTKEQAA